MADRTPLWTPEIHAGRRRILLARGEIMRALREKFASLEFVEIETPALQVSPGNEIHLQAFSTEMAYAGLRDHRYLRSSPEFACKKLLAAGEQRIVEFARVFRNGEYGPLHHPEFTIIEWYRAHEPYGRLMDDCMAVVARAAETAGSQRFSWRARTADPVAAPERITVAEAFSLHAKLDLLATLTPDGPDRRQLAAKANDVGVRTAEDDSWADIFSRVMAEKIEPHLGVGRATLLDEYPSELSALARPKASDPRLAERFELFICGVELANGFGELTDAGEQRRRLTSQMTEKNRIYGERYPIDEEFIAAVGVMPPACGVALGFDRLVMLATGATHIEQVMWTPVAEL